MKSFMIVVVAFSTFVIISSSPYDDGKYNPKKYRFDVFYDDGRYYRPSNEGKYIPRDEGRYTYIYRQFIDRDYRYLHKEGPRGPNGEYIGDYGIYADKYKYFHQVGPNGPNGGFGSGNGLGSGNGFGPGGSIGSGNGFGPGGSIGSGTGFGFGDKLGPKGTHGPVGFGSGNDIGFGNGFGYGDKLGPQGSRGPVGFGTGNGIEPGDGFGYGDRKGPKGTHGPVGFGPDTQDEGWIVSGNDAEGSENYCTKMMFTQFKSVVCSSIEDKNITLLTKKVPVEPICDGDRLVALYKMKVTKKVKDDSSANGRTLAFKYEIAVSVFEENDQTD